jgi:hypothetical protein
MKLLPLAVVTFFVVPLCNSQNDGLSIGGKQFRLGMTKHEVLQLAPLSEDDKSGALHSMEGGDDMYPISRGKQLLGMLGFTNDRLSCIIASGPSYLPSAPLSELSGSLLAFFAKMSGGQAAQLTIWTEKEHLAGGDVTREVVHLRKPPYEYTLSKTSGIGEPVVSMAEMLGTCRRAK